VDVDEAGFLREYVWFFFGHTGWGQPPGDIRVVAFLSWALEELADHLPQTHAEIRVTYE
jgi:hypothetical protein